MGWDVVTQGWLDSFGGTTLCEECHAKLHVGQEILYLDPEGNRAKHVDCREAKRAD